MYAAIFFIVVNGLIACITGSAARRYKAPAQSQTNAHVEVIQVQVSSWSIVRL